MTYSAVMAGSTSETAEQFGARMMEVAQSGFVASGLSMGKDLGLFDAMKALDGPATCQQIADEADVKERYTTFNYLSCIMSCKDM